MKCHLLSLSFSGNYLGGPEKHLAYRVQTGRLWLILPLQIWKAAGETYKVKLDYQPWLSARLEEQCTQKANFFFGLKFIDNVLCFQPNLYKLKYFRSKYVVRLKQNCKVTKASFLSKVARMKLYIMYI